MLMPFEVGYFAEFLEEHSTSIFRVFICKIDLPYSSETSATQFISTHCHHPRYDKEVLGVQTGFIAPKIATFRLNKWRGVSLLVSQEGLFFSVLRCFCRKCFMSVFVL
jgi:hypothetical protein